MLTNKSGDDLELADALLCSPSPALKVKQVVLKLILRRAPLQSVLVHLVIAVEQ